MSKHDFTVVGVASDGVPVIRSDEVQELLHDLHTEHLAAIQAAKVVAEIESYKRTMKMQIPDWLSHKLAQEVKRCEDLLTQLNKEKRDV